MNRFLLAAFACGTLALLPGCDAQPTTPPASATPDPATTARATPKAGSWMWDKKQRNSKLEK